MILQLSLFIVQLMLSCNATTFDISSSGLTTIDNVVVPHGTTRINAYSNSITNISNTFFHNMSTLQGLYIYSNLISKIEDFSFIGVPTLQNLVLLNNRLTYVGKNMFKGLFNLGMALYMLYSYQKYSLIAHSRN